MEMICDYCIHREVCRFKIEVRKFLKQELPYYGLHKSVRCDSFVKESCSGLGHEECNTCEKQCPYR